VTQLDPVPNQPLLRDLLIDARERDQKGATLRHQMKSLSERSKQRPRIINPATGMP
jgi:hypothetical protein